MAPRLNGFMLFYLEWKRSHDHGYMEEAGKIWETMSKEERSPYVKVAKDESAGNKLNVYGISVNCVLKVDQESKKNKEKIMNIIEITINNAVEMQNLADMNFYFIMFNHFDKKLDGTYYVPAEVALGEFSLVNGINRMYSTLINPGMVLFGNIYQAQLHSQNSHMLPIPPNALGDKDLLGIYSNIIKFVHGNEYGITNNIKASKLPPLYTYDEHVPIIKSCLEYLSKDSNCKINMQIFPILHLFYVMKCALSNLAGIRPPDSHFITDSIFIQDYYEYHSGISCKFHEESDRTKYCAQSRVARWGYMFAEHLCPDLNIKLKANSPVLPPVKLDYVVEAKKPKKTVNIDKLISDIENLSINSKVRSSRTVLTRLGIPYAETICSNKTTKNKTIDSTKCSEVFPALPAAKESAKLNTENVLTFNCANSGREDILEVPRQPGLFDFNMLASSTTIGFGRGRSLVYPNNTPTGRLSQSLDSSTTIGFGRGRPLIDPNFLSGNQAGNPLCAKGRGYAPSKY